MNVEARGGRFRGWVVGGFFICHVFLKPVFGVQVPREARLSVAVQLIWLKKCFEPVCCWEGELPHPRGFPFSARHSSHSWKACIQLCLQLWSDGPPAPLWAPPDPLWQTGGVGATAAF